VVAEDLIGALDRGSYPTLALDALSPEPLPPESPLWLHPKSRDAACRAASTVGATRHRDCREHPKHRGGAARFCRKSTPRPVLVADGTSDGAASQAIAWIALRCLRGRERISTR